VNFQIESPIGYPQPFDEIACAPVNATAGEVPQGECTLGDAPVFTVNATSVEHIAAGIAFAEKHNIRIVLRDTGHDFLGRSSGFGSLQIWIRHLRTGIDFHETFTRPGSSWNGSAFTIGGGYEWIDVYEEAAKRDVIVVGGVSPTVGCIGGWMQGGGHGPPTHKYGLGSDQVLEAKVVLANGTLVTASPTEHADLFYAIRGGGPSSYGVVISATVKAWPTTHVVAQSVYISTVTAQGRAEFLDAIQDIYAGATNVSKGYWGGYGDWIANEAITYYQHKWTNFDLDLAAAQAAFAPLAAKLEARNSSDLVITIAYTEHATYADFYNTYHQEEGATGGLMQIASRFLDEKALSRSDALAQMLNTTATASPPAQLAINTLELYGSPFAAVGKDGSAANPAFRTAIANMNTYLTYDDATPASQVDGLIDDITNVKEAALRALAPDTGSYGNVANIHNPEWKKDFFGDVYEELLEIKSKYDPHGLFYCRTCVGSDNWEEDEAGRLCAVAAEAA
jgi:FAD/FMN-containing dehydrogenase